MEIAKFVRGLPLAPVARAGSQMLVIVLAILLLLGGRSCSVGSSQRSRWRRIKLRASTNFAINPRQKVSSWSGSILWRCRATAPS
jgi:hypothetical protein